VGDYLHPTAETALATAPVDALPRPYECGLRDLVGLTKVTETARAAPTDRGVVASKQFGVRISIARLSSEDESGVAVDVSD
jgi:hypothetical protein